jgi:hypothetical protein
LDFLLNQAMWNRKGYHSHCRLPIADCAAPIVSMF